MTRTIIRAVPSRADMIAYLRERLPDAEWVIDPDFHCTDMDGRAKSTANFLRGLKLAGAEPAIHMEEDVLLTRGFREKAEAVIARLPNSLIQFFSMRSADLTKGSRWDRTFTMNQCFYLPAGYSVMLGEYLPTWHRDNPEHPGGYDYAMGAWLKARKERYWIHCPSLVDHRPVVSFADKRRSKSRQSKSFTDPWL